MLCGKHVHTNKIDLKSAFTWIFKVRPGVIVLSYRGEITNVYLILQVFNYTSSCIFGQTDRQTGEYCGLTMQNPQSLNLCDDSNIIEV